MDTVLGLSMTPTTVGLVLVEGDGTDTSTRGHDAFGVRRGGFSPVTTSAFVAEALSRTRAIADGNLQQHIRVTWSDDAAVEASLLLESLAECGFDNVVPIRLPEATETFARGIGEVIGSDITAVCVIESDAAIVLVVEGHDSVVLTAVSGELDSEQDLTDWLAGVLEREGWQPDGLVLLGAGELKNIAATLQGDLGIPVFAPAEAELALARGAALSQPVGGRRRLWTMPAAPMAMLIGGILTFVVSASMAVGIELLPNHGYGQVIDQHVSQHVVNTAETPSRLQAPAPAAPVVPAAPPETAQQAEPSEHESLLLPATAAQTMVETPPEAPATEQPVEQASADAQAADAAVPAPPGESPAG